MDTENNNQNNNDSVEIIQPRNITNIAISNELKNSFIDYAMSVIISRALPDVRDGLKPVHRRILFAMHDMKMLHNTPFKKSARVIGEVIAKYHPHGDAAVYESMVRLAQPFSLRYPLVWGQGNFGSVDGDSPAAMRYTETKLKKITNLILDDIDKDVVDFKFNYDESESEPAVLPSKLPNLLINGSTGIAVGMATSIPPHNITEVLNAAKYYSKNPNANVDELMEFIKGPDFPTSAEIINQPDLKNFYETGKGRMVTRSKVIKEFVKSTGEEYIVITEIPYMVNKTKIIEKIAEIHKNKILNSIREIKDESSRKGIRIVIRFKRGFNVDVELNKLFKFTQLQSTFSANFIALEDGAPKLFNLTKYLRSYINYQITILIRKTNYILKKSQKRKHILEGLNIALKNIDKVIKFIKDSKNNKEAIEKLMSHFSLSLVQAEAIMDMKLQRLTGLEKDKLIEEISKINIEIDRCEKLLASDDLQTEEINKTMDDIIDRYGDDRRTQILNLNYYDITEGSLIKKERVVVTLTKNGYVKRIPLDEYRLQKKGGKGSKSIKTKDDDHVEIIRIVDSHTNILFFSSLGKVYRIKAYEIPQYSKISRGIPIVNLINTSKEEKIQSMLSIGNHEENVNLVFVTKRGKIKATSTDEFIRINKNGKKAIKLNDNDELLGVKYNNKQDDNFILIAASNGKLIRFNLGTIREQGRNTSGSMGIRLSDEHIVKDFAIAGDDELNVLCVSERGFGKLTKAKNFRQIKRGGKGVISINVAKAGKLVGMKVVNLDSNLFVITNKGTTLRCEISGIREVGRNSKGVTIVRLNDNEKITAIEIGEE